MILPKKAVREKKGQEPALFAKMIEDSVCKKMFENLILGRVIRKILYLAG